MKEEIKKPIYKRWWFIAIVAVFFIGIIGSALEGNDDEQAEEATETINESDLKPKDVEDTGTVETISEEPVEEETPINEMTVEEYAQSILTDKIGEEAEAGVPSIESIEINDTTYDFEMLVIALNETVTLSVNMARDVMLLNTLETAQAIVEEYGYEGGLSFIWSIPLTDNLGNEEYDRVLQLDFDSGTLAKMNFSNIAAKDLGKAADMYFEHPAIKPKD